MQSSVERLISRGDVSLSLVFAAGLLQTSSVLRFSTFANQTMLGCTPECPLFTSCPNEFARAANDRFPPILFLAASAEFNKAAIDAETSFSKRFLNEKALARVSVFISAQH